MESSGITRRIDELGRIVIPKEMRYNLGIRDGELLEIIVNNNTLVIKKFSQMESIKDIGNNVCNIIGDICNVEVMISDREKIVATTSNLKNLIGTNLSIKDKKLIDFREVYISENKDEFYDIKNFFTIIPIVTSHDSCGLVFIISNLFNNENLKYAKIAQKLIIQKIDIAS